MLSEATFWRYPDALNVSHVVSRQEEWPCQALQAYLQVRPVVETDLLFVNKAGEPLGERGVQKMVRKYMDIARIKGASVESLRHTFGTHHAAKGTSLKTIQEVMGHQDSRTTEIYISLARQMKQQELEENAL